jgi:hypothetical protein
MFEPYFISVIERFYGRKLSAMVAQEGAISARAFRGWLDGTVQPDERRQEALRTRMRQQVRTHLEELEWPDGLLDVYVAEMGASTGVCEALIHIVHWRFGQGCPATLELSRRIDELSQNLAERRKADDLKGFVQLLFDTEWLSDDHFNYPEHELDPAAFRASAAAASAWSDVTVPVAALLVHVQLQLLATLDHEFGARYMPTFTPTPVFLGLFPDRVKPKEGVPRSRGEARLPAKRLLHMLACMRYYKNRGRWPSKAPSVDDTAKWMDVLPTDLSKWRMGRRFTLDDFEGVWDRMFKDYSERSRPGEPIPLMLAMVVITRLCVLGSREGKNLSLVSSADALYVDWWGRQRAFADAQFNGSRTGTEVWMPGLL